MRHFVPSSLARGSVLVAALAVGSPAVAQPFFPETPVVTAGGRLTLGGSVSGTFSCATSGSTGRACGDDVGFFNYTDYEHSALRTLRLDLTAALQAAERVAILGELRSENAGVPEPYALYVRIRPWTTRAFTIQAGRVPPAFGAFARRAYPSDNLLIGYPLAYQYLTSLRADAVPADADELLRMRGRGWLSSYSVGEATPERGVPLVNAFRWDTGVQAHAAAERIEAAVSVTTGTLANPLVVDDNAGKQLSGRVAVHPAVGLTVGVSAARGPFVGRDAAASAGAAAGLTQQTWGTDAEYSRDYYVVRVEAVVSDFALPIVTAPALELPLRAVAISVEGRYRLSPRLHVAARGDRLTFSEIAGSAGRETWDAPVTRIEVGGGYALRRTVLLKGGFQHNARQTGRGGLVRMIAAQVVYWF